MRYSIEAFFLFNFILDSALIAVIARANECMNLRRVLLAGFLGAVYAVLTRTVSERLAHPLLQLILLVPLGLITTDDPEPRRWIAVSFQLACGAMMLGGAGALISGQRTPSQTMLYPVLGGGLLLLSILFNARAKRLTTWEVTVCLQLRGKSVSFRALIDTGNRLREPLSGLPVLIAEAGLLDGLRTELCGNDCPSREIAFGALGGSGTIRCFHPDKVLIRRGNRLVQAPEVWVAVYPGKIPGSSRALAPPSFAIIPGKT